MPTTVLLVDDDPIARRVIDKLFGADPRLKPLGIRVVHAGDGQKALAAFTAERPQVVITDLFMPGMDGFALCRALRATPGGETLPLVVISGVYKDPALTASLADEFHATFLSKPIASAALADAILAALGSGAGASARVVVPEPVGMPDLIALPDPIAIHARVAPPDSIPAATHVTPDAPTRYAPPSLELPTFGEMGAGESGSLSDAGAARIFIERIEAGTTGTLVFVRGQVRKEIYFRDGRAVAADSNMREEALGTLLCAKGIIDEPQLAHLLTETKKRGQKMGAVLVELGWMSPEEVLSCLAAQARKRIGDSVRWDEGTWSFIPGDSFGDRVIEYDIDLPKVLFTALLRTGSPEALVMKFDPDAERPIHILPRFARYRASFDSVFGPELAPILAEGPTLGSVLLRPNVELIMVGVDALLATGMAELAPPVRAAPERERGEFDSSFSLARLSTDTSLRALQLEPADELFSEGPHALPPSPPPAEPGAPAAPYEGEDSGVVELAVAPKTNPGLGPAKAAVAAAAMGGVNVETVRRKVLREYLDVHGKAPHELLGIAPAASNAEVARAYEAKAHSFSDVALGEVDLGPDAPKLEAVRVAYRKARDALGEPRRTGEIPAVKPPAADPLGAELAFGEGLRLLAAGRHHDAMPKFEDAVRARPDQALYHAYLGWALFLARGAADTAEARDRLVHALALDPDSAKTHELLGKLAIADGDHPSARMHLERALELDPSQHDALELVIASHARTGDARGAERFYRRVIAALGERGLPARRRLWRELGELYDQQLEDPDSARIAFDTAAQLAPDDIALQRRAAELNAVAPTRWRETARALATQWQLVPQDRQIGAKLCDHLTRVGQEDPAAIVAAALVLRGAADERTRKLAAASRPAALRKLTKPLDAGTLERLGYSADDRDMEALIAALSETGVMPPFSIADLGLETARPLAPTDLPQSFRRVLKYVAEILDVPEPSVVYRHPALAGDARMADVRPYALLVGPALLAAADTVELGFRLGRALALAPSGRAAGASRTGRQLRPYVMASLTVARGTSLIDGPDVEAIWRAIIAGGPELKAAVAEIGGRILRRNQSLNLTKWSRGLGRFGTRVGLLVSGDLPRVGRAVADEDGPASLDELLAFALSLEHIDLREELGLATVI